MVDHRKISYSRTIRLLIVLFSLLLIPYIILCFYAHPVADDYNFNQLTSFWGNQWKLYHYWNGRYSANFMVATNPIIFNSLIGYRLSALVMLLCIPASIYFALSASASKALSVFQKMVATAVTAVLTLNLLPSLPEGIYWYTGSVTYILGAEMAIFYVATVIMYRRKVFIINRFFHSIVCIVILFLSVGFNEVQMLILLFAHLIACIGIRKEGRFRSFYFLLFLFCILFSALVFFSQGNHYRESYFPNSHNLINSVFMSLLQMARFFFSWVSYAPLLLASILFIPLSLKMNKRSLMFQKIGNYNPLFMFLALWVILFLCIFPAYWSTGILGQYRTLNAACFFFVPAWFLFLHSIYTKVKLAERMGNILTGSVQITIAVALAVSLLFSGNSGTALLDLGTGKITDFDQEMNKRIDLILDAKRQSLKEVSLPFLQNRPKSLFVLDIRPGCTHWINQVQAQFFGLDKICADSLNTERR